MANDVNPLVVPQAPSNPGIPATDRLSVPASAVFPDDVSAAPARALEPAPVATPATPSAVPSIPVAPAVPAQKPNEPAVQVKPSEEPAPVVPAAPAVPAAPTPAAPESKVKIGDKEYTREELEKALADRAAQPAPVVPPAPVPPTAAPTPPTPEEVAKKEGEWLTKFITDEKLNLPTTEAEMETILAGGKEGAELLSKKMTDIVSRAVLLARKSLWSDSIQPVLNRLMQVENNVQPLMGNAQQIEAAVAEQQFFTSYPEFTAHAETVKQVGEALIARYPKEFFAMSRPEQLKEVAAQTENLLNREFKRWNPTATGTWRDAAKTPSVPVVAVAPVAPAVQPAAPAAVPRVPAPNANSPAATPAAGVDMNWHKQVANSLVN